MNLARLCVVLVLVMSSSGLGMPSVAAAAPGPTSLFRGPQEAAAAPRAGEPGRARGAAEAPPAGSADLAQELALLWQGEAARLASDYVTARAKAAEAVAALLARPDAERDAAWVELLHSAGVYAWNAQDGRTAELAFETVLELRSRTLSNDHPDLQQTRLGLAAALYMQGEFNRALALTQAVVEIYSRTLPDDHPDLQVARQNLAALLKVHGRFGDALALEEKVLEVRSRVLAKEHPDLLSAWMNVAATLHQLGDLRDARPIEERVLELCSRTRADDDPFLQMARGNLALTLADLGDLQAARALQQQVVESDSRTLPDDHPDLQLARNQLARTIAMLGDLSGARALFEKVLEVGSRTLPDEHIDLQVARANVAATLYALGDVQGARQLIEKVVAIRSHSMPEEHPDLLSARLSLGLLIRELGDLGAARRLEEQVLEVRLRTLPDDHPDLQRTREDLAWTLVLLGDLAGARTLEEQVLAVRSRTLPDDHPDLQRSRRNLALTIGRQAARSAGAAGRGGGTGEESQRRCVELVASCCRSQMAAARSALLTSSAREAEERCARLAQGLDIVDSFAAGYGVFDRIPALDEVSFLLAETTRGAALASARIQRLAADSSRYAELREELRRASEALASLAQSGTGTAEFRAALARREGPERKLVALAGESSGSEGLIAELDVEKLASTLGERDALVGFHRCPRWTLEVGEELDSTGEPALVEHSVQSLCALVLRSGVAGADGATGSARLERVELGPIESIESAVHAWRASLGVALDSRGVGLSGIEQTARDSRELGRELRRLVFDPLLPALAGIERVIVALDDVLNLVPLDALPEDGVGETGSDLLLGDRLRIETRVALAERLVQPSPIAQGGALVALGGVAYDGPEQQEPAATLVVAAHAPREEEQAGILRGGAWSGGFPDLPETDLEAKAIARRAREAFGSEQEVDLLTGRTATRDALEALAPRARWLHVATHGWFAPESIRSWSDPTPLDEKSGLGRRLSGEEEVKGMSPMLLCGLALAGANLPVNALGRVPGLVTAEELSTLDLSGCELAVLSACDTNVGERRAGQGVASLQRALQMAGARSVITSLWKVPDEATRELMVDFYRRLWAEKKPKWQALWEAKKRLRDARDERGEPEYTTRDWAAWVLSGDPR